MYFLTVFINILLIYLQLHIILRLKVHFPFILNIPFTIFIVYIFLKYLIRTLQYRINIPNILSLLNFLKRSRGRFAYIIYILRNVLFFAHFIHPMDLRLMLLVLEAVHVQIIISNWPVFRIQVCISQ